MITDHLTELFSTCVKLFLLLTICEETHDSIFTEINFIKYLSYKVEIIFYLLLKVKKVKPWWYRKLSYRQYYRFFNIS